MKKRLLLATGIVALAGGTTFAVATYQPEQTVADEEPPIVQQVNDHEVRITDLEEETAETQEQVERNTADIAVVRQQVAPVAQPTPSQQPSPTPAPKPADEKAEPKPQPEPEPHPRTIVAVDDQPRTGGLHTCAYTLHDPTQRKTTVIQPLEKPCLEVGEVLS